MGGWRLTSRLHCQLELARSDGHADVGLWQEFEAHSFAVRSPRARLIPLLGGG